MKKVLLFSSLFAFSAFGAEMEGVISDAKCGAAHADASAKSMKCVAACVKGGQDPVLVSEGKVYKIADDSVSKVQEHLGHKVVVDGKVDGDTVEIASIEMAKK